MSVPNAAFTKAVLRARAHVRWGGDPIMAAKDLQQEWLRLEADSGVVEPRGASDAFVTAVRVALGRATEEPESAPAVRRSLAERLQAQREEASHARV